MIPNTMQISLESLYLWYSAKSSSSQPTHGLTVKEDNASSFYMYTGGVS